MKKSLICFTFCLLSVIAYSQTAPTAAAAPKAGVSVRFSPGSTFKVNLSALSEFFVPPGERLDLELSSRSFSADIVGRYYLAENFSARFGIGMGILKIVSTNSYLYDDGEKIEILGNLKQNKVSFTPALERHFRINKLELLTGLGLPVTVIGKTAAGVKGTYTYAGGMDIFETTVETEGGFGVGVQSFAGFNFYFNDKFAVGTEITYGVGYSRTGGNTIFRVLDNGTLTNSSSTDIVKVKGINMLPLNAALVLTMNF